MSVTQLIPELINHTQPPILPGSPIKTEALTAIKNEPSESEIAEIGIDNILNASSEEEIIPDIKNIDIISHILGEDSIKSEADPQMIPDSKCSDSVETQIIVKAENAPFVKIENLSETEDTINENVNKGCGQEVVKVQDNQENQEQLTLNFSNNLNEFTCETTSQKKDKAKIKVFKAPLALVEPHEYISLAKNKHVCNHCQHTCKKLKDLKRHIRKIHRKVTTTYQCPYCPFKSKWKGSVRLHIMQKHKDTKDIHWFQCYLCNMKFKLKFNLSNHMLVHFTHEQMQDQLKVCPICGKVFKRTTAARNHIKFVHNKEDRNKVEKKCEECEYTTTKIKLLKHHIKSIHKKHEKKFGCDKCSFRFKKYHFLKLHKLSHKPKAEMDEQDLKYQCDKCEYKTYRPQNFKMHKLNHLKPEEIRYFYCYHCPYKSKRRNCFSTHVLKHFRNEDVQFHCYICNFITVKRDLITEHIKKHAKLKLRELPQEAEIEINDGHLKYRCDKCKYKTLRPENFKKHILIHLKPEEIHYFYCNHCSLKCKRKDQLKAHIFRHFKKEEVEFHCYICDFVTVKRDLITEHIKNHPKLKLRDPPQEADIANIKLSDKKILKSMF